VLKNFVEFNPALTDAVLKQMSSSLINSSIISDQSQVEELRKRMEAVRKSIVSLA